MSSEAIGISNFKFSNSKSQKIPVFNKIVICISTFTRLLYITVAVTIYEL